VRLAVSGPMLESVLLTILLTSMPSRDGVPCRHSGTSAARMARLNAEALRASGAVGSFFIFLSKTAWYFRAQKQVNSQTW